MSWLEGVHTAPNIQSNSDLYELENRALDPGGHLLATMRAIADWRDRLAVDLGAGTGFWVPHLAREAKHVFAIEPDDVLRRRMMARLGDGEHANVSAMAGSAAQTMLAPSSVDIVHARFAYFWGPGCEPGIEELARILRPGGTACIIDNDLERGVFASWLARLPAAYQRDQATLDAFWRGHGFDIHVIESCWRFETRDDLERVVALEFTDTAPELLAEHEGLMVPYVFRIYSKTY